MSENLGNFIIWKVMSLFLETSCKFCLWKPLKLDKTSRNLENVAKLAEVKMGLAELCWGTWNVKIITIS